MGEVNDLVLTLDRKQSDVKNPERRLCQTDPSHGALWPHGSGSALLCNHRFGQNRFCDYVEPVSLGG